MNREIKFRAWDKKEKVMESWEKITEYMVYQPWWNREDLELMQFTGLHDENGKEIYEGDLLATEELSWLSGNRIKHLVEIRWDEKYTGYSAVVVFKGGENSGTPNVGDAWAMNVAKDFSVIGNIYQNPELLEGQTL